MTLAPLLLLAQGVLADKMQVVARKSFPASRVSRIEITVESGAVTVKARPGSSTRVEAVKPEDSDGHCDLKLRLQGDTLSLEAKKPQGSDAVCDGGFEVQTQPDVAVQAYAGSGDVEVEGVSRTVKVHTGSGEARIKDTRGKVYVMTGSGEIRAELPSAAFDARSGSGDIDVALSQGSGLVSLRTGSGDIKVSAPKGAKLRLHASTASGTVSNPFPPAKTGPLLIEAFSGSGNITLTQRSVGPR